MPKYKDIPFTNATKVLRRHSRDVSPPGLVELKNGYISRSDNCPEVRPPFRGPSDYIQSIPGTSIDSATPGVGEADFLNSYFYSWGANAGFYLTKFGPVYEGGGTAPLYDTYDAGTFTCDGGLTVEFNVTSGASLIENVWPGCLLLYDGTYYVFNVIVDDSSATLETSPGAVSNASGTIIRIHDPARADMPFHISQYGVNMVYSTPQYRLPMDTSRISGPFYLPLNDYKMASPWKDTSSDLSTDSAISGFPAWLHWHRTHAYERERAWRSAVPLMWHNGKVLKIFSISSNTSSNNTGLLPVGEKTIDGTASPSFKSVQIADWSGYTDFTDDLFTVKCLAYGSLADGQLALYTGLQDGTIVKTPLTAFYGTGNVQHFLNVSALSASNIYAPSGSWTTVNRIRDVGFTNHADDTTVWAVCDAGLIVQSIADGNEIDTGAGVQLYDVGSSRRPDAAGDPDGDVVVVGAGGTIYYAAAEDDPSDSGNWTSATSGVTVDLNWCFYSEYNDKFVVAATAGNVLLSNNAQGSAWTSKTTPSSGEEILDVACDENGRIFLFVCGDNKAYATTDFANYNDVTPDSLDDETILSCTYCTREGKFVIGGTDGYIEDVRLTMKQSGSASTIAGIPSNTLAMIYFNSLYVAVTKTEILTSPGGASPWTFTSRATLDLTCTGAALVDDGTTLVAVLAYGYPDFYWASTATTDGTTWGAEQTVADLATAIGGSVQLRAHYDSTNSIFIASTTGYGKIYISSDGSTWAENDGSAYFGGVTGVNPGRSLNSVKYDIVRRDRHVGEWDGSKYVFSSTYVAASTFDVIDYNYEIRVLIADGDNGLVGLLPGEPYRRFNNSSSPKLVELVNTQPGLHEESLGTQYAYRSTPSEHYYDDLITAVVYIGPASRGELSMVSICGPNRSSAKKLADIATAGTLVYGMLYDGSDFYAWYTGGEPGGSNSASTALKIPDTFSIEAVDY